MVLNVVGLLVALRWQWLQWFYPNVLLDEFIVMPDHLHGIIKLGYCRGAWPSAPTGLTLLSAGVFAFTNKPKPLGRLIGAFKTTSTKITCFGQGNKIWQRDFNDRVVRSKDELEQIRRYIRENPIHWKSELHKLC
ncbi:MAG TPA: hypothetical protein VJB60_03675 [Candidatus Peribacterales bacterium]|nr:hypothetical protein [Candidatus Peribacterales bacterium]